MQITEPLTRGALLAQGWDEDEVRRLRRDKMILTLRRGRYAASQDPRLASREGRHLMVVRAASDELVGDAVVSHQSAALLHGLTIWGVGLRRVQFTRPARSGGIRTEVLRVTTAPLRADEVVDVDGVAVTSVARTISDVARTVGFERGVVVADAALRRNQVQREDLAEAVARSRGWPGVPNARRVLAFADGRSESVGESRSRVAMAQWGLPVPDLQHTVRDHEGRVIARCDFGWGRAEVVGEFDGRIKYGRTLDGDVMPEDVLFVEKRREDAIRDTGLKVVRWVWDELDTFSLVAGRIKRAHRRR